ncbi:MAG: hypothetical protein M3340_16945 [Actinomycetota bacterium]|nr:hypothetical protein [Actinomycetota bacterium]
MPVSWPDHVDRIIDGDLTAGLAYVTPAGGSVVTAVAPIGLRDRERGTVGFTTSLGLGRKLERLVENPRVALAYHTRKHGFFDGDGYVLVQGDADVTLEPDADLLETDIGPRAERYLGKRKQGVLWDRWLREYYQDRVLVDVRVRRVVSWPAVDASGAPEVVGEPLPEEGPPSQKAPKKGTGPRVDVARAASRARKLGFALLAHRGADGYPMVVPVQLGEDSEEGLALSAAGGLIPPGERRAGLVVHDYEEELRGIATRQFTGWLTASPDGALYAPHTEQGFNAPSNKTLLLLVNGLLAKRGLRKARREGTLERLRERTG